MTYMHMYINNDITLHCDYHKKVAVREAAVREVAVREVAVREVAVRESSKSGMSRRKNKQ